MPISWELRAFSFLADDASATLSFRCLQNANLHFAYIDGAGIAAATPAPGASHDEIRHRHR